MSTSYYFQVMFSLLVLMGILYGVYRLSRSVQQKKFSGEIEVKDRVAVHNEVSLVIVDIRGEEFLLSVSPKQVSVIKQLS